ncbi:hypothetical protein U14_01037 [Candidatus Moduliflexus flocculans]|uniref:Uncharacterized protein n=1 Tax=Candidatus Moduliflexus flocculans TaxID=1499966 RepID=A0A0S6VRB7_9BACT|nr:hypothetical protein U14_01037 [Candidatus Moduliflexus flocculans]
MPKTRHEIFQQMSQALAHQQRGNVSLALSYWENVLRLLPAEFPPIQPYILDECRRLAQADEAEKASPALEKLQMRVESLALSYRKEPADDETEKLAQQIFRAIYQQCGGNYALSLAYWKNALSSLTSNDFIISLMVQDFCWQADELLRASQTEKSIDLYTQLLRAIPDFLEGYINLSLILYRGGQAHKIPPLLNGVPQAHREEFLITRYRDLFQRIADVSAQFDLLPYAAIEPIAQDLRIHNTFYPLINERYFNDAIEEIILRERRANEKRRKALEEKAIAQTAARLAKEGISVGQRVTMARLASSEEIPDFLYDNNIRVIEILLNNPNLTADDVLIIAQTTHVSEVLSAIAHHHRWSGLYPIRMAILFNPQTLPKDAFALLKILSISDLAKVYHKKSISTEIRIRAKEEIQQQFQELPLSDKIAMVEATSGDVFKLIDRAQFTLSSFLVGLIGRFHESSEILINICRWKLTPEDVLVFIGRNSALIAQLRIVFALLSNPNTPTETVRGLLRRIPPHNLRYLSANKLIPSAVKRLITEMFPDAAA